jgi:hypothetical protein
VDATGDRADHEGESERIRRAIQSFFGL